MPLRANSNTLLSNDFAHSLSVSRNMLPYGSGTCDAMYRNPVPPHNGYLISIGCVVCLRLLGGAATAGFTHNAVRKLFVFKHSRLALLPQPLPAYTAVYSVMPSKWRHSCSLAGLTGSWPIWPSWPVRVLFAAGGLDDGGGFSTFKPFSVSCRLIRNMPSEIFQTACFVLLCVV